MAQAGTLVAEERPRYGLTIFSELYDVMVSALDIREDQMEALTETFYCLDSMRPRGDRTVALEKEWRAALSRKAAIKVAMRSRPRSEERC